MRRQPDPVTEVAEAREALAEAVDHAAELLAEVAVETEPQAGGLGSARPGANAPAAEPAKDKE